MAATEHEFKTEVNKLLNLLANSLYSNKEVFLRELISNASDAIDKLHFMALTKPELTKDDPNFRIRIRANKDAHTLTVEDNGLGMTLDEANSNLGTIAKSGTEEFVKQLSGDAAKDSQLIGQFGVGFYSAFIVADRVEVFSRSATVSPSEGVHWVSTGNGSFSSEQVEVKDRGTKIVLHLRDDASDYLNNWTLREAINKYSDHISTPVEIYEEVLEDKAPAADAASTDAASTDSSTEAGQEEKKEPKFDYVQVNDAKALWTRPAKEITEEEYQSFYKHTFNDYSDALSWSHNKVDGDIEYTSLLFIPAMAQLGMRMREHNNNIKLYVQRVFIMDDDDKFLPPYLRFIRGLVDTNDLPLNVSRELLQESKVMHKLKTALTKRALNMIESLSSDKEKYGKFVSNFNDILKEGLSDDYANRDKILKLLRFASTYDNSSLCNVSLDDYISRMPEKQTNIYYLCADDYDKAINSPYLERLKSKNIEVILLWKNPIDSWISAYLNEYQGKKFVSVANSNLDLGELEDAASKEQLEQLQKDNADLVQRFKDALGGQVSDVKVTDSLSESPACLVKNDDGGMSQQLRIFAKLQGTELPEDKLVLELNVKHSLIQHAAQTSGQEFADFAKLIFLQASLTENGTLKNPREFISLTNRLLLNEAPAAASTTSSTESKVIDAEPVEEFQAEVVSNDKDSSIQL